MALRGPYWLQRSVTSPTALRASCTTKGLYNLQSSPDVIPLAGRLLRMFWLVVGNVVLYAVWLTIVITSAPLFSALDAAAWGTAALMLIARRVDVIRYKGRTVDDRPATLRDWRLHTAIVVGYTCLGGLIAHQLGGSLLR